MPVQCSINLFQGRSACMVVWVSVWTAFTLNLDLLWILFMLHVLCSSHLFADTAHALSSDPVLPWQAPPNMAQTAGELLSPLW